MEGAPRPGKVTDHHEVAFVIEAPGKVGDEGILKPSIGRPSLPFTLAASRGPLTSVRLPHRLGFMPVVQAARATEERYEADDAEDHARSL